MDRTNQRAVIINPNDRYVDYLNGGGVSLMKCTVCGVKDCRTDDHDLFFDTKLSSVELAIYLVCIDCGGAPDAYEIARNRVLEYIRYLEDEQVL